MATSLPVICCKESDIVGKRCQPCTQKCSCTTDTACTQADRAINPASCSGNSVEGGQSCQCSQTCPCRSAGCAGIPDRMAAAPCEGCTGGLQVCSVPGNCTCNKKCTGKL